jgi:hypothetical protein
LTLSFSVEMEQIAKVLLEIPDCVDCDIDAEVGGVEV